MQLSPTCRKLEANSQGRDFVVGDIHGQVSKLQQQLAALGFNHQHDRLICVGDLIDRGAESAQALDLLAQPWFFAVLGNHEYLMYSGLKLGNSKHKMMWLQHGGEWIASSDPGQWPQWFTAIEQLPLAIEVRTNSGKSYGIVHAEFPAAHWQQFSQFDQALLEQCIWGRSLIKQKAEHQVAGIDAVFHGHTIVEAPLTLGNRHYIECGAYKGADFQIIELV